MVATRMRTPVSALVLSLGALLAPPQRARAQSYGSVSGVVRQSDDGAPLPFVTVVVKSTGTTTVTSPEGRYVLPRVPPGPQTLVFRIIGFRPEEHDVIVTPGGATTFDIALTPRPFPLGDIEVSAASLVPERIVEAPAAVSAVPPSLLRAVAPTGQLPLALAATPGVDIAQGGNNDFNVNARGLNSANNRRVLVLVDGRDVALPFAGSPTFEWSAMSVPLDESARVEMVRGPGSALYGADAFSGVLDIHTAAPREIVGSRVTLTAGELGTLEGDLRHAGLLAGGRLGYRVSGGYRTEDQWARSRTSLDSLDLTREYDAVAAIAYPRSREVRPLNGQHLGTFQGAVGDPDPTTSGYGAARVDWYAPAGWVATAEYGTALTANEVFVTGTYRLQRTRSERPFARFNIGAGGYNLLLWYTGDNTREPYYSLASGVPLSQHSGVYQAEFQLRRTLRGGTRIVAGASQRLTRIDTDSTLFAPADDHRSDPLTSVFGQAEIPLLPRLRVVAAVRGDASPLFALQTSPKLAVVFEPRPGHVIRATMNRAFRAPSPSEQFIRAVSGPPLANPRVQERAIDNYFASVTAAVASGSVNPSTVAGLDAGRLPWNFDSLTVSAIRGNRNLKVERVLGWELGYKAQLGARGFVTVDLYRNDMSDFVTTALPGVNPDYPQFSLDSGRTIGVRATLDSLDARLAAQGVPTTDPLRSGIPGLRSGLTGLSNSTGARLATTPAGTRALILSSTNASRVTAQGVEVAASIGLTPDAHLDASLTWFDFAVRGQLAGDKPLKSNTPRWKGALGVGYAHDRFDLDVTARFVDAIDWLSGNFAGPVPSSATINVAAGYRLSRGLRLHCLVTDLTDQQRYYMFGGAVIGRRAVLGMTANF